MMQGRVAVQGIIDAAVALNPLKAAAIEKSMTTKVRGELETAIAIHAAGKIRRGETLIETDADGNRLVIACDENEIITINGRPSEYKFKTASVRDIMVAEGWSGVLARCGFSEGRPVPHELKYIGIEIRNEKGETEIKWQFSDTSENVYGKDGKVSPSCSIKYSIGIRDTIVMEGHTHPFDHEASNESLLLDLIVNIAEGKETGVEKPEIVSAVENGQPVTISITHVPGGFIRTDRGAAGVTEKLVPFSEDYANANINAVISERGGVKEIMANLDNSNIKAVINTVTGAREFTTIRDMKPTSQAKDALSVQLAQSFQALAQKFIERIRKESVSKGNEPVIKTLEDIERRMKESAKTPADAYKLLVGLAMLAKEAKVFTEDLELVMDCRTGGFDAKQMLNAIRQAYERMPMAPVKYVLMVNEGVNLAVVGRYANKVSVVASGRDPNEKFTLNDMSKAAVATTESNAGFVIDYYERMQGRDRNGRFNAFIVNTSLMDLERSPGAYENARMAAFFSVMMRLASQDQTTVITAGCSKTTISSLQEMLKSGFRLIRLAKLEIDKLVTQFLAAISATGGSA